MGYIDPSSDHVVNYEQFRDIFSSAMIERLTAPEPNSKTKKRHLNHNKKSRHLPTVDAEELGDFASYVATETFVTLPPELQSLDYQTWADSPNLQERYALPLSKLDVSHHIIPHLSPSILDTLTTYGLLVPNPKDLQDPDAAQDALSTFLTPMLTTYITTITTPPPATNSTRKTATACETCDRDWVPLTYHHLIPRKVHAKAVKRGWHREEDLQNVAWLCRACHSFVHQFAGHEVLAREFYTVELLMEAKEVQDFARWVGKIRWKGGKT